MTRFLAFVAILATVLLIQLIWAARQPTAGLAVNIPTTDTPPASTVEIGQRALEDLASWPAGAMH